MTTQSALGNPTQYRRAHAQVMRFLAIYHDKLIGHGLLDDVDVFVNKIVTPHFGRIVDPNLFDHALTAYGCVQAVQDGSHEDIQRNPSGVVDNTLWLLDREQDYLDKTVRDLLNSVGIS